MEPIIWLGVIGAAALIVFFFLIFLVKQYKRCPSNRILVIYGKVGSERASKCLHGGGAFVIPLIQDHEYLSLEPLGIEIPLEGALSLNNIRVNVPSTFTGGSSTDPVRTGAPGATWHRGAVPTCWPCYAKRCPWGAPCLEYPHAAVRERL